MQSAPLINPTAGLTHRQRLGRCYELSGLIALHNPRVTLVHGSIQGFNFPRIAHAWVMEQERGHGLTVDKDSGEQLARAWLGSCDWNSPGRATT